MATLTSTRLRRVDPLPQREGTERRGWKVPATGVLVVVALAAIFVACGGGDQKSSVTATQMCAATAQPEVTIGAPDIKEASGIAASRRDDNVLWVHNDSGDTARFFAIDRSGKLLATFSLQSATATDWEDIAIGPGPMKDAPYLYLADIGDNAAARADVTVYRIAEPKVSTTDATPASGDLSGFDTLTLKYPDHPHDAETFMVDPTNGDMLIITKELADRSRVYRAPASTTSGSTTTLQQVAQIDFQSLQLAAKPEPDAPMLVRAVRLLPTGGDISPDGSLIAVRTYGAVWIWSRAKNTQAWDAFNSAPCQATQTNEQQGEAIAFDRDGHGYVTTSEGVSPPLHQFRIR